MRAGSGQEVAGLLETICRRVFLRIAFAVALKRKIKK